jgi:hypothetical protein
LKINITYEVVANGMAILVINSEGIDKVLNKKFDGNELPPTATREQIVIICAERFV